MNNKGQLDYPIITFIILLVGLFLVAPIMLKIFISIREPMSASFGNLTNQGGAIAQGNFNKVMNTAINFWDKVIISVFFFAIILLFVSAFFIDANPFFIILYIFISFMVIIFAPNIMEAIDNIYTNVNFATEVGYLTFLNTIRTHFAEFIVGIQVICGIIIYGKYAFLRNGGVTR